MDMNLILASIGVFLVVVLLLVVILLVAKNFLVPSGNVKLTINGEKELEVASGSTLLNTLSVNGIFLSSACGGKGSCGQCKCQVVEGGGEILPSQQLPSSAVRPSYPCAGRCRSRSGTHLPSSR
jgi:Na+-transporting NADH:ubiquinone oxidoreductase subunit F